MSDGPAVNNFASLIEKYSADFKGREWVLEEINRWLNDANSRQFFFIAGEPGIGKTAIAVHLINRHLIDAYHFCVARDQITIDPASFVRSICRQLARNKDFSAILLEKQKQLNIQVEQKIGQNAGQAIGVYIENLVIDAQSASSDFVKLVIGPLLELSRNGKLGRTIILIDALDEAIQHTGLDTIVSLLANLSQLPPEVRFICTTRPDKAVLSEFEHTNTPPFPLHANNPDNREDIRYYTEQYLAAMLKSGGPSDLDLTQAIDSIVDASEGNFLYLKWLLPGITAEDLAALEFQTFPRGLDGIYKEFFKTRLGKTQHDWQNRYRDLFGILVVAQTALSELELLNFTGTKKQILRDNLQAISQFLDPALFQQKKYSLYHQSISDFLRDESKSSEFWIDATNYHQQITAYYSQVTGGFALDFDKLDSYGLQFLSTHLFYDSATLKKRQALYDLFTGTFSKKKREQGIQTLLPDVSRALSLAVENQDYLYLIRLLLIYAKIKNEILEGAKTGTIATYARERKYSVAEMQADEIADTDLHFRQLVLIAHIALLNNDADITLSILKKALKLNTQLAGSASGIFDGLGILLLIRFDDIALVRSLAEKTHSAFDSWLSRAFGILLPDDRQKAVRLLEAISESGWTTFFKMIAPERKVIEILDEALLDQIVALGIRNKKPDQDYDWHEARQMFADSLADLNTRAAKQLLELLINTAISENKIRKAIEGIHRLKPIDYSEAYGIIRELLSSLLREDTTERQVAEDVNRVVSAFGEFNPIEAFQQAFQYCIDVVDSRSTRWFTFSTVLGHAIRNHIHVDQWVLSQINPSNYSLDENRYVFDDDFYGKLAISYARIGDKEICGAMLEKLKQKKTSRYLFWSLGLIYNTELQTVSPISKKAFLQAIRSFQRNEARKAARGRDSFSSLADSFRAGFEDWDLSGIDMLLEIKKEDPVFFGQLVKALSLKDRFQLFMLLYSREPASETLSALIQTTSQLVDGSEFTELFLGVSETISRISPENCTEFLLSLGQNIIDKAGITNGGATHLMELLNISLALPTAPLAKPILERLEAFPDPYSPQNQETFVNLALNLLDNRDDLVQKGMAQDIRRFINLTMYDPYLRGLLTYAFSEISSQSSEGFSLADFAMGSIIALMTRMAQDHKSLPLMDRVDRYLATSQNIFGNRINRGIILANSDQAAAKNILEEAISELVWALSDKSEANNEERRKAVERLAFGLTTLAEIQPAGCLQYLEYLPVQERLYTIGRILLLDLPADLKTEMLGEAEKTIEIIGPARDRFDARVRLARTIYQMGDEELFRSKVDKLTAGLHAASKEIHAKWYIHALDLADIAPGEFIDRILKLISAGVRRGNRLAVPDNPLLELEGNPAPEKIWPRLADIVSQLSDKADYLEELVIISVNIARSGGSHESIAYIMDQDSILPESWFWGIELKAYQTAIASYADPHRFTRWFNDFHLSVMHELESQPEQSGRQIYDGLEALLRYLNPLREEDVIEKVFGLFEFIRTKSLDDEKKINDFFARIVNFWSTPQKISYILRMFPLFTLYDHKEKCISRVTSLMEEVLREKGTSEINLKNLIDCSMFSPVSLSECASISAMLLISGGEHPSGESTLISVMDQIDLAEDAV
jgi:hypothetical protein